VGRRAEGVSILTRHVLREMIFYFALVLVGAVAIYMVIDFFDSIDNFLEAGLATGRIVVYFAYKLPLIIMQVMPVGILLAAMITLGLMNRNNEILAVKTSGLSVWCVLRAVVFLGVVVGVMLFFFSETVVPIFSSKANTLWRTEVKKETAEASASVRSNIWIKQHRTICHIGYYNPHQQQISGVSINFFDDAFRLVRRLDAERGVYRRGAWVLFNGMDQVRRTPDGDFTVSIFEERIEPFGILPEDLRAVAKRSEEMNCLELWDYIEEVDSEHYNAAPYWTDFHAKFARPASGVLLLLVAGSLALKRRMREKLVILIAVGGGLFFLHWVIHSFCLSMGYGGVIPPLAAAWSANGLFAIFAVAAVRMTE
jgi:lipopolysaccharide export system permease protein